MLSRDVPLHLESASRGGAYSFKPYLCLDSLRLFSMQVATKRLAEAGSSCNFITEEKSKFHHVFENATTE